MKKPFVPTFLFVIVQKMFTFYPATNIFVLLTRNKFLLSLLVLVYENLAGCFVFCTVYLNFYLHY
jgi:hypothetical protein